MFSNFKNYIDASCQSNARIARFHIPKGYQYAENKYDEITAHGWCQIQKSLYWVKPVNKDITDSEGHKQSVTFAHLVSVVLEKVIDTSIALYNKKD